MTEHASVLFANAAFYNAFTQGDMVAMTEVWSSDAPLTCVHPGWPPLEGSEDVMESWRMIFESGNSPQIHCKCARAYIHGNAAYVTCYEVLDEGRLAATNVFIREGAKWRMVHHQAGTAQPVPLEEEIEEDMAGMLQ